MEKKTSEQAFPETWVQFCQQTGRDPNLIPDVSAYDDRDKKHAIAEFKLTHMIRHVNDDKVDHTNSDQWKYEIWWEIEKNDSKPSGLGLSYYHYDDWRTNTICGPRLCFLRVEDLKKASTLWLDLFEDLIL